MGFGFILCIVFNVVYSIIVNKYVIIIVGEMIGWMVNVFIFFNVVIGEVIILKYWVFWGLIWE